MINEPQSVADLTALLEAAKKDERIVEEARRRKRSATRKAFLATHPYIYTVTTPEPYRISTCDVEVQDVVYVSRQIDPDAHTAFFRNRPADDLSIFSPEDLAKHEGINYYLTADGIIHHSGGGTIILKTPQLCDAADWQWLKAGNIPVKFLRSV